MSNSQLYYTTVRKNKAASENMKITYFKKESMVKCDVGVIGNRKIPYIINFGENSVSCSCPDFKYKSQNYFCKHIYFIIGLSENKGILESIKTLKNEDIKENIGQIMAKLEKVVDIKKMEKFNSMENRISIERDDCCSICMDSLERIDSEIEVNGRMEIKKCRIEKCKECQHVFHYDCINSWWKLLNYCANFGKCAYCRHSYGLIHVGNPNADPWQNFDHTSIEVAPAEEVGVVNNDTTTAAEAIVSTVAEEVAAVTTAVAEEVAAVVTTAVTEEVAAVTEEVAAVTVGIAQASDIFIEESNNNKDTVMDNYLSGDLSIKSTFDCEELLQEVGQITYLDTQHLHRSEIEPSSLGE